MDAATLISSARRRAGVTQRELADRAGTSPAAISLYESGQRIPRVDTLARLIAATGHSLEMLVPDRPDIDLLENAATLEAVLELADHLPRRSSQLLDAPIFADLAR